MAVVQKAGLVAYLPEPFCEVDTIYARKARVKGRKKSSGKSTP